MSSRGVVGEGATVEAPNANGLLRAHISAILARADTLRGMLQGCVEALVRDLDVAFARIWTLRPGGTMLELEASAGLYTHLDGAHARVRVADLKIGLIAHERRPYLTTDVRNDPRIHDKAWAARERIVAFAGYPLIVDEHVVGVMAMFSKTPITPETLDALSLIASSVAQGIERKRSEERLRRSEAYLAEGQRLTKTGSWAWNLRTGERFWSREVFHIYGFEATDVPPPFEDVIRRVHPNDFERVRHLIESSLHSHTDFRFETKILIPGHPVKWVETVGHPVRDESGSVVEFIGTDIDVTERRRANHRLQRAIKARYEAVLAERARIARDMHDGLLQNVTGISLQLAALLPQVRTSSGASAEKLDAILELTKQTAVEARRAVVGMRSVAEALETDPVRATASIARRIAAENGLAFSLTVSGRARRTSPQMCEAAAAIVHEAVTNVVKHADARMVKLRIAFRRKMLRLAVIDDGRGLASPDRSSGHFGLVGMRERATAIRATFTVRSVPRGGTLVRLDVPL